MNRPKTLLLSVVILAGLCVQSCFGQFKSQDELIKFVQNSSCMIESGNKTGSGVLISRKVEKKVKRDGVEVTECDVVHYVLTCAHVLTDSVSFQAIQNPLTNEIFVSVDFKPVSVVKEFVDEDGKIGECKLLADILKYSPVDGGEDLAILKIRKNNFISENITMKFYLEREVPPIGREVYHCGNLRGSVMYGAVTYGIISQISRIIEGKVYDQTSAPSINGGSGGALVLKGDKEKADGRYIGMIIRIYSENFVLYSPIRRIKKWTDSIGMTFILDDKLPIPSDEEIKKGPIG